MEEITKGLTINNRYTLEEYVGNGTFGEVWRAYDKREKKVVAIKIYISLSKKGCDEFLSEYELASGLKHGNLVATENYGVWNNRPFIIMEFCPGGSAADLVGKLTPCEDDERRIWEFIRDVSAGLAHLHQVTPDPIVHQDIKPDNIMIGSDGKFMIADFGISKKIRNTMSTQSRRKLDSGATAYMAPERFSAHPNPILASDMWSLGASIYELAEGELPFAGMGGVMLKNGADLPDLSKGWSKNLNFIMRSCLNKETWNRPKAKELYDITGKVLSNPKIDVTKEIIRVRKDKVTDCGIVKVPWYIFLLLILLAALSYLSFDYVFGFSSDSTYEYGVEIVYFTLSVLFSFACLFGIFNRKTGMPSVAITGYMFVIFSLSYIELKDKFLDIVHLETYKNNYIYFIIPISLLLSTFIFWFFLKSPDANELNQGKSPIRFIKDNKKNYALYLMLLFMLLFLFISFFLFIGGYGVSFCQKGFVHKPFSFILSLLGTTLFFGTFAALNLKKWGVYLMLFCISFGGIVISLLICNFRAGILGGVIIILATCLLFCFSLRIKYKNHKSIWQQLSISYNDTLSKKIIMSFIILLCIMIISYWLFLPKMPFKFQYAQCPDDNHPHSIDMGFPSGTRWACCNVGAQNPEEYGGYYSWGETQEKSYYDLSSYSNVDDIETQNDVAHVLWGKYWALPNYEQIHELIEKCISEPAYVNGIIGMKLTSKYNKATIFLPAAGCRSHKENDERGIYGYYMTSVPASSGDEQSSLFFESINIEGYDYSLEILDYRKYLGFSVRPVDLSDTPAEAIDQTDAVDVDEVAEAVTE